MKEVVIKNITLDEFKKKYTLQTLEGMKSYPVTSLGELMEKADGKTYFLIGDKLYDEPNSNVIKKEVEEFEKQDAKKIEDLHDKFRDSLIDAREYLYSQEGERGSERHIELRRAMNKCIAEGKEIVDKYNFKDGSEIKKISNKFFIPDFINALFDTDVNGDDEDEIDCGL